MEPLKPCPFCGGKASHTTGNKSVRQPDMVQCLVCGVSIEEEYTAYAAFTKWNTRAEDSVKLDLTNALSRVYDGLSMDKQAFVRRVLYKVREEYNGSG